MNWGAYKAINSKEEMRLLTKEKLLETKLDKVITVLLVLVVISFVLVKDRV